MSTRKVPFQCDEWFHCFNRGIDKRDVFESEQDANRFLLLLYIANSLENVRLSNILDHSLSEVVSRPRSGQLVSIGAYCLMHNHYHLLLKEIKQGGISQFMQKLGTAYTMYFNKKYSRVGNLFLRPFRALHVGEDRYFQRVVDYIHCNPAEKYEPDWKRGIVKNIGSLEKTLLQYPYSSFADYAGIVRTQRAILSNDGFNVYRSQSPMRMLEDSRAYYAAIS